MAGGWSRRGLMPPLLLLILWAALACGLTSLAHAPDVYRFQQVEGSLPPVDKSRVFPPKPRVDQPNIDEVVHPERPVNQWVNQYQDYQKRVFKMREHVFELEPAVEDFANGSISLQRMAGIAQVMVLEWEAFHCCVDGRARQLLGYQQVAQAVEALKVIAHFWRENQKSNPPAVTLTAEEVLRYPSVRNALDTWKAAIANLHVMEQVEVDLVDVPVSGKF